MKKKTQLTALCCMLLAGAPMAACSSSGSDDNDIGDRPGESLERLMKAIADGDAKTFASMCDYPVSRPYPLRDIEDAATMEDYFPVMADDSLRRVMREATPDEWELYGWRGWSLPGLEVFWYDEGVQYVPYVSAAERGLQAILARQEIESLSPEYREGWTPVDVMAETDGSRIYRIDRNGDAYRLMAFPNAGEAGGNPEMSLTGSMQTEGSAQLNVYLFGDTAGVSVTYIPDGEVPLSLYIARRGQEEERILITKAYWRDLVKFGKSKENQ